MLLLRAIAKRRPNRTKHFFYSWINNNIYNTIYLTHILYVYIIYTAIINCFNNTTLFIFMFFGCLIFITMGSTSIISFLTLWGTLTDPTTLSFFARLVFHALYANQSGFYFFSYHKLIPSSSSTSHSSALCRYESRSIHYFILCVSFWNLRFGWILRWSKAEFASLRTSFLKAHSHSALYTHIIQGGMISLRNVLYNTRIVA